MSVITFSRAPGTKVPIDIESTALAAAQNTLVLVGRMASGGGTCVANVPYIVENYGDSVAALDEAISAFGAGSEVGDMLTGAIEAVETTDLVPKTFPPIIVIPMAFGDTALAAALNANINMPMPFLAQPFPASNAARLAEFLAFCITISAEDRGRNGQFGTFGFTGGNEGLTAMSTEAESAPDQSMLFAWIRDLNEVPANETYVQAAALAALAAANGLPFLPLNDVIVGGLLPPTDAADRHTPGDAGSEASGLEAGAVPLMTGQDGRIRISRTVTARRTEVDVANVDYIDMQDWQTLYYLRLQIFELCQQDRYKRARNSTQKQNALKSEIVHILLEMQKLEMLANVEAHVADILVTPAPGGNIYATQIDVPADVVPGFHNKGVFLHGITA